MISLVVVSLRLVKLWEPTVHLLEKMAIKLGKINISIWGLIEAIIVFILLWIAAGVVNRFFTQWLTTSTKLTYSDRTLILRIVKATSAAVVILITLRAAGIHLAAFLVTGGAIGVAIGFGLREIGSNMACGIVLLLRKPIEKGDVIALEESIEGADYGWITQIGIMYVHVSTRNGTKKLIPNETFVTNKVEILSSEDNVLRLHIPFGIAYESDLKKATGLALDAAMSVDRILKNPEPKCRITDFGENEVKLQLRVWINDPQNGISNVKGAILSTIWEAFHANGIVFPFPQRDLHIKDAVPLKIYEDHPRPVAKVSLEVPGKDGDAD